MACMLRNFSDATHSDVYYWIWFQTWYDDRYCCTLHFDTSRGSVRSKNFCANYLTKFSIDLNGNWLTLRLVGVINSFCFFYSVFKGENPTYIGLYSDMYRSISCKHSLIIETLHCDISLDDLDLHSKSADSCLRNQKVWWPFSHKFIDLGEIQYVATTCWFVEAHHYVSWCDAKYY